MSKPEQINENLADINEPQGENGLEIAKTEALIQIVD